MSAKRLVPAKVSPEIYRCVVKFDELIDASTLGKELIELIKVRVSQINGCAYCIDTHTLMARKTGISERKLYLLNAWSEAPLYNPRERAALGWADALTRLTKTHADDEYYEPLTRVFDEKEIVDLTFLISLINVWNRLALGMRYELSHSHIEQKQ